MPTPAPSKPAAALPDGIEIFRAGRHIDEAGTAHQFSEADLDGMASSYNPALREAPLTVVHPQDNLPAYGWVKSVTRNAGGMLLINPHQVEPQFAEMVEAGRFKKRSASFYPPQSPNNPMPGKWYLRHVAFLGAQPPAVAGLKDIAFSAADADGAVSFSEDCQCAATFTSPAQTTPTTAKQDKTLMDKEMQAQIDAANKAATDANAALLASQAATKAAHAQLASFAEAAKVQRTAGHVSFAEGEVKAGRLLPKDQGAAVAVLGLLADSQPVEFSEGGATQKRRGGWARCCRDSRRNRMNKPEISFDMGSLQSAYRAGAFTPLDMAGQVLAVIGDDPNKGWIHIVDPATLRAQAQALMARSPEGLALWGIPFAIKDNIDLAGVPTTAGCPDYAYTPERSASLVQRLIDASAIAIGKTNLDQFATGLNGTRSPYGACRNAFNHDYVSGGSSAGSAVSVALGQVSFSLGTDTAGSGRVPAGFNHLVGLKPSLGLRSTAGVVPACRSLDVLSIFALTADDAQQVFAVAHGIDAQDAYSRPAQPHGFDFGLAARPRLGVPHADQLPFLGDSGYAQCYADACAHARALGAELVEIDFAPFVETARLLYEGPWVAER